MKNSLNVRFSRLHLSARGASAIWIAFAITVLVLIAISTLAVFR